MNIKVTKDVLAGPSPIPNGFYKATISGSKVRTSRSDNPVLNLECTINSQGPDETVKTIGRKVFIGLTITEAALGIVARDYKGITGNDLPLGDFTIDEFIGRITSDCMGKSVLLEIESKPNPNDPEQIFSNVKKVQPAD